MSAVVKEYPNEFLGRCSTCLDNAYLSSRPCPLGFGNGQPMNDAECSIRRARKEHDEATPPKGAPT